MVLLEMHELYSSGTGRMLLRMQNGLVTGRINSGVGHDPLWPDKDAD